MKAATSDATSDSEFWKSHYRRISQYSQHSNVQSDLQAISTLNLEIEVNNSILTICLDTSLSTNNPRISPRSQHPIPPPPPLHRRPTQSRHSTSGHVADEIFFLLQQQAATRSNLYIQMEFWKVRASSCSRALYCGREGGGGENAPDGDLVWSCVLLVCVCRSHLLGSIYSVSCSVERCCSGLSFFLSEGREWVMG